MELRTRSAAHEAQRLFFQIGMEQRAKVGTQLGELGLGFAQAHALRMLDPEEPLPMSALAERLFCDASNVTGIVDRLEGRAREAIHQVNTMRKELGLEITDRIALTLPPELAAHEAWIARETLASRVEPGGELAIEKA